MKWTTANFKNGDYNEKHELYVGTETGAFKKLLPNDAKNPYTQSNLQDIKLLEKDSRVTALAFGNEEQTQIFMGHAHRIVEEYSLSSVSFERAFEFKQAPVVGLARYDEQLIAGCANGELQVLPNMSVAATAEDSSNNIVVFSAGDDMSHLRQCFVARNLVATGGKGRQNNLKVFDLAVAGGKPVFSSKNLPNDFLQLEVPVWDSDVGFIEGPHTLATCSRYGYVRVYDTRKQRRPVQCYATEDGSAFTTLAAHGNYIYSGTTMGVLRAFDIRKMKNFLHTYKGFTGSVADLQLDGTGKYLTSACLDRYVRVHDVDSTVLLYQCYVKSKATRVLIREAVPESKFEEETKSTGKAKSNRPDEEYEKLFTNMETVNDDESDAETTAATTQVTAKRKIADASTKIKRKKV